MNQYFYSNFNKSLIIINSPNIYRIKKYLILRFNQKKEILVEDLDFTMFCIGALHCIKVPKLRDADPDPHLFWIRIKIYEFFTGRIRFLFRYI
mgnify:CR=1 FL=1